MGWFSGNEKETTHSDGVPLIGHDADEEANCGKRLHFPAESLQPLANCAGIHIRSE